MAADDLYSELIPPPLAPLDLGVSPLGPAPAPPMPTAGQSNGLDKIMSLIAAGIALKLGPGAGTGLLQGVNTAQQQKDQQRRQADLMAQQDYRFQQQQYAQDEQRQAREMEARQRTVTQTLDSLRKIAPTLKTKDEYDRYVEAYGQGLKNLGFRVDGNYLRSAVPYSEPKVEGKAQALLDRWLKVQSNADLLKNAPEDAMKASVMFDRDGDGIPEAVSLPDLASLAQMPFAQDGQGQLIFSPAGTTKDAKANADAKYQELLTIARAEGKLVDGATAVAARNRSALMDQANKETKLATQSPDDPILSAIRGIQLGQLRSAPPQLPPAVQRRVDALVKGFDTQPSVKRAQMAGEAVSFSDGISNTTTNPADDIGLLYAFAKAMDPDSVVREGEYATVKRYAQSWAEQFRFNAARVFSNTAFLTPEARRNLKATIRARFNATKAQYDNLRRSYGSRINRVIGGPGGEEHLTDYGGAFPEEPTAPGDTAQQKLRDR